MDNSTNLIANNRISEKEVKKKNFKALFHIQRILDKILFIGIVG